MKKKQSTTSNKLNTKKPHAFSSGAASWESTLKKNAQSKGVVGKTSQNKK